MPQSIPLGRRIEIWQDAVTRLLAEKPIARMFELYETGLLVPWTIREDVPGS